MNFSWSFVKETAYYVLKAVPLTMLLTFFPVIVGLIIGFLLALEKIKKVPVVDQMVTIFNSFFRSIPLLVLLFLSYYGIPKLLNVVFNNGYRVISARDLNGTVLALITLTLYSSAFLCEIVRGALSSVDEKQMEAAHALGMTKLQTYFRIIIPQAVIIASPNYFNFVLALLKHTSVVFTISVVDMMSAAKLQAEYGYRYVEAYTLVAIFYIIFSLTFSRIFKGIEKRAKHHMGR